MQKVKRETIGDHFELMRNRHPIMRKEGNGTSSRRRSHKEMMLQSSNGNGNGPGSSRVSLSTVYATEIPSYADDTSGSNNTSAGIFRSRTARAVLTLSAIVLLFLSFLNSNSNGSVANLKDLSDTVTRLTLQLHSNFSSTSSSKEQEERIRSELADLKHQLEEKKIELAWEKEHVENQKFAQQLMHESMKKQIMKDQEYIHHTLKDMHKLGDKSEKLGRELMNEENENANLKAALSFALEELAKARAQLPPAPGRENGSGSIKINNDINHRPPSNKEIHDAANRKLRANLTGYHPGDNIEIIEYQEGGKVALRPGIVSEKNHDGTFNLVKLEQSILIKDVKESEFQSYHVYHEGFQAFYEINREQYAQITIVQFLPGSARPGFELHGHYKFTYDDDENDPKTVNEGPSMRMHRYAGIGEVIGTGSNRDQVMNEA